MRRAVAVLEAAGCAGLFLALAGAWALVVPAAEAPDEAFHVLYAAHIARERRLPVVDPPRMVEVPVEGNQPPLYYLVGALVLRASGQGKLDVGPPPHNPASTRAGGSEPAVYDHRDPEYPWSALERAVRTLRFMFLPVGAVVVLCCYGAARLVRPEDPSVPILAGGLAATLPQFTFVMGSVTNDVLANGIGAVALLLMFRVVARGRGRPRDAAVLGMLVGLGLMTKMTLLFLVAAALVALGLAAASVRRAAASGALFLVAAAAVALPAFLRYLPWGDPFGLELNRRMFESRLHDPGADYWLHTFVPAQFFSFWGVFGHMNIHLGEVYWVFLAVSAAALAGLGLRGVGTGFGRRERRAGAVVASALALLLASIVTYNASFAQPQGRYWFPALVPITLLLATGLGELLGSRRGGAVAVVAALAAVNAAVLALVVAPAYGG